MAFSESFLQELAERNELVELVGAYVPLTRKSGSYWGCCPFHSEKTPSFHVIPDRQFYHCFGCGKGGGAINFIMEIENLSYPDAVAFLANRAGMEVPDDRPDRERQKRDRMLALNREAARFFYSQLLPETGRPAQNYILRRGISPAVAKRFGLGFAPNSWNSLLDAMKAKGFSEQELFEAGLVRQGKNGGHYDTFRNRLMFPVIDVRGSVIGFSGRILDDGEPKYMNTPETLVFNKSRNLFSMNLAKKSKSGYIILAEGNIDVVALHQAGFDSAVASLGTSLTAEQTRLIARYTKELIIAYDSDTAGYKAAERAISLLDKLDLKMRVLSVPEGKDPDEFIKRRGADAFRNLLEKTENHIEYRLDRVFKKYDLRIDEQKADCVMESAKIIAGLPNSVSRDIYAMRLADQTGVAKAVISEEVERERKKLLGAAKKRYEREALRPAGGTAGRKGGVPAEEGIIRLLYKDPALFAGAELGPEDFSDPFLAKIYLILREKAKQNTAFSLATLGEGISQEEVGRLASLLEEPDTLSNGAQALADYIQTIKTDRQSVESDSDLLALARQKRNMTKYGG